MDLFQAREARDAAMAQVMANTPPDWKDAARDIVARMKGEEVTGEDIRFQCERQRVQPHHSNAWGAFIAGLVREGVLEKTGRYVQMRAEKSHARETKLYRVM